MKKAETTVEEPRDAKLKLKIRTPDGAHMALDGLFPNKVTFAIYMLACDWGDGRSHKGKSKRDVAYEKAAQTFLAASNTFYSSVGMKAS
jgi:hypothetical protein